MRTRYLVVPVCSLLVLPALALPSLAATAGPVLTAASPKSGQSVSTFPSTISATFDRALAATSTFSATGPNGTFTCAANAPAQMTLSCTPGAAPTGYTEGLYTVSYKADSAATPTTSTSSSYTFTYDKTAPAAPSGLTTTPATYNRSSTGQIAVSGTSESATDSVTVTLAVGGGAATSMTVTPDASKKFTALFDAPAGDGTLTATATSTDAAGNTGATATATGVKDTVNPTVASSTPIAGGAEQSKTGTTVNGYSVTASELLDTTMSTLKIFNSGGNQVQSTTAVGTDKKTLTTTPSAALAEGSYTAQATLVDANGNAAGTVTRSFTIDNTAPVALSFDTPEPAANATTSSAYVVTGKGEPGATVTLAITDSSPIARSKSPTVPVVVTSNGLWTATVDLTTTPASADGALTLVATQTDAAGNTSPSASTTSSKDTVVPTATIALDKTKYGSSDTTATATGTISSGGTNSTAEAGDTATVSITDGSTTVTGTATSGAGGSYTVSGLDISALSGNLTATVVPSDPAGNKGTAVTAAATRDTTFPAAPVPAPKKINKANAAAYTVSGTAEAATTVTVLISDGTKTITATATATSAGAFTTAVVDVSSLADGPITVTATAKRASGNASPTGSTSTTKDVVAPATPALADPQYVNSATVTTAPYSGTAEAGSSVVVTVTDSAGATKTATLTVGTDGTFSSTLDLSALADGALTWKAVATDAAGNASAAGTGTASTKDVAAPVAPATVNVSAATFTARSTVQTISGTTGANDAGTNETATYTLTDAAGHRVTAAAPVTAGTGLATTGTFTHDFSPADLKGLDDSTISVSVTLTDLAGNTGAPKTASFVKDTIVLALTSASPSNGSIVSKPSSASVTFNEPLSQAGTTTTSSVVLTDASKTQLAGSTSFSPDGKTMTFTPGSALSDAGSNYTLTYKAFDSRDTADTTTGTVVFTVDSTPPVQPSVGTVTSPVTAKTVSAVSASGETKEGKLAVVLTFAIGSATKTVPTTSDADGHWNVSNVDLTGLPDGTLSVTAVSTDRAGNSSQVSTPLTATKDTAAPVLQSATPQNGSTVKPPATVVLGFDEPLGSTSSVTVDGVAGSSSVSGKTLTFTPAAPFADGTHTATATTYDSVGNAGTASTTFTTDGTGPTTSALGTTPTSAGMQKTTVTGTTEKGATVALVASLAGSSVTGTTTAGSDGSFTTTLDLSSLGDGTVTVTATSSDTLGNAGTPLSTSSARDTTAPVITGLAATGTTSSSKSTTVTGNTGESGDTVTVVVGTLTPVAVVTGTDGSFNATVDASSLADGSVQVSANAVDMAPPVANTGPTAKATFSKDTAGATVTNLRATDTTTAKPSTAVTGTTEKGATVTFSATDGTTTVTGTTTVAADGSFSGSADLSGLADGSVTVSATATDSVGNAGSPVTVTVTKDTTGAVVTGLTATSTTATKPATSVTGSTEPGATVGLSATDGLKTVSGKGSVAADGSVTASLDLGTLGDGQVTVTATATDARGNTGSPVTTTLTKDSQGAAVTGLAASDTSTAKPATTVTGSTEKGATVALSATSGGRTATGTATVGSTGTFSGRLDLTTLPDGTVTVTATATDAQGNVGSPVTTTLTKDSQGATVSNLAGTGTTAARRSTSITGTTEQGATVVLSATDGTTAPAVTGAGTVAANGSLSGTLDLSSLADGTITLTATADDAQGNTGATATTTVVKDTQGANVAKLAATGTSSKSPSTSISGTTEPGATVALSATDGTTTPAVTGSGTITADGSLTGNLDLSSLEDGTVTVTAVATDASGNTGAPVTTTLTKDATAPAVTGLSATASTSSTPSSTVTGTRSEGSSVHLTATDSAGKSVAADVAAGTGSFSATLDLSTLKDGTVTVSAVATDAAGNTGTASTSTTKTSTTAPGTPGTPAATAGDARSTVSFTAPSSTGGAAIDSYTVTSSPGGVAVKTTSTTATVTGLTNGTSYTFTVTAHNSVGSGATSAASNAVVPRGTSTLTLASPATTTSGQAFNLTGTVTRTDTAVAPGTVTVNVRTDDGRTTAVGSVHPASNGTYSLRTAPTVNGTYTAVYNGDSHVTGTTSAAHRTIVGTVVKVTSPKSGAKGAHTTALVVKGTVSPNKSGHSVALYQVLAGGKLKSLGTAKIASNGTYTLSVKLAKANYTLQVGIGATTGNGAGTSARFTSGRT